MSLICKEKILPHYIGRLRSASDLLSSISREENRISVLLFGGDLKHVLRSSKRCRLLDFYLADSNWQVLARDVLLVNLLSKKGEKDSWIVKAFVQTFYSLELDEEVHGTLLETITECIADEKQEDLFKPLWREWLSHGRRFEFGEEIRKQRQFKVRQYEEFIKNYINSSNIGKSEKNAVETWYKDGLFCYDHLSNSRINVTMTCLNPSKERLGEDSDIEWANVKDLLVYAPHAIDSPFQDWDPCEIRVSKEELNLKSYVQHVEQFAKNCRDLLLSSKLRIIPQLVPRFDEAKMNSFQELFKPETFRVIDTGLMADVKGTGWALEVCYPWIMSEKMDSVLYTHHRLWQIRFAKEGISFKSSIDSELGINSTTKSRGKEDFSSYNFSPCQTLTMPDKYLRTLQWQPIYSEDGQTPSVKGKLSTKLSEKSFECKVCRRINNESHCKYLMRFFSDEDVGSDDTGVNTEVSWASISNFEGLASNEESLQLYSSSSSSLSDTDYEIEKSEREIRMGDIESLAVKDSEKMILNDKILASEDDIFETLYTSQIEDEVLESTPKYIDSEFERLFKEWSDEDRPRSSIKRGKDNQEETSSSSSVCSLIKEGEEKGGEKIKCERRELGSTTTTTTTSGSFVKKDDDNDDAKAGKVKNVHSESDPPLLVDNVTPCREKIAGDKKINESPRRSSGSRELETTGKLVDKFIQHWDKKVFKDSRIISPTKSKLSETRGFKPLSQILNSFNRPSKNIKSTEALPSGVSVREIIRTIEMNENIQLDEGQDSPPPIIVETIKDQPRKSSFLHVPSESCQRKRSVTFDPEQIIIETNGELNKSEEERGVDIFETIELGPSEINQEELVDPPSDYRPPTPPGKSHNISFPKTPPPTPAD